MKCDLILIKNLTALHLTSVICIVSLWKGKCKNFMTFCVFLLADGSLTARESSFYNLDGTRKGPNDDTRKSAYLLLFVFT